MLENDQRSQVVADEMCSGCRQYFIQLYTQNRDGSHSLFLCMHIRELQG